MYTHRHGTCTYTCTQKHGTRTHRHGASIHTGTCAHKETQDMYTHGTWTHTYESIFLLTSHP